MGLCFDDIGDVGGEALKESFILYFGDNEHGTTDIELNWESLPNLEAMLKKLREYKAQRDSVKQ